MNIYVLCTVARSFSLHPSPSLLPAQLESSEGDTMAEEGMNTRDSVRIRVFVPV